jgi:hypothetical protein
MMIMKIIKYLGLALVLASTASCQKHEIEYITTPLSTDMAEFQLHYVVPLATASANNVYMVKVNDSLLINSTAPLTTFSAVPKGTVGKFFTTAPGSVNLKMYQSTGLTLAYDQNVTLTSGKQNVFVYSLTEAPKVFDNGYPYSFSTAIGADSLCYIKFYNFLYEDATTQTALKLQYQYVDTHYNTNVTPNTIIYSDTINIGNPVAFGETTGWQPVKVVKTVNISAGSNKIYFLIKVIDANGKKVGDLSIMNSKGLYQSYTDNKTESLGRRYHHILGGIRTSKTVVTSTGEFTAL